MSNIIDSSQNEGRIFDLPAKIWKNQKVWLAAGAIILTLGIFDSTQAIETSKFTVDAVMHVAPYLLMSIAIAAWASATGADNLIASAFKGSPFLMIILGAIAGGLSPFCSCGVIPLIAALLSMGVPLYAVMAFWLASPIMDPSMFVLTSGVLGFEFAVGKTIAAIGIGTFGGLVVQLLSASGALSDPLRDGVGNGGCGGSKVRAPKEVVWSFWKDSERVKKFSKTAISTTMFLAQWLTLAFILESLMLAWIPAETVTSTLGGEGLMPILIATLVGVPAYLNGYAALPLVGGLIEQGMASGAGMAFLVAGGVTSIPAAMAVWALARPKVFAIYIGLSLSGAFMTGLLFQLWKMI
ncbi:permease [Curvivirga aplysinae]|uniref:permease n=1 Tax=Curvivirga aplysinae TaxID=2529852 RepID=UPI0012BC94BA|nr:permease [Curvivirga aplysinae]MTI08939.1 permease [Curvivirga aplysinae]